MKCKICNKDFSMSVYPLHLKRCKKKEEKKKEDEKIKVEDGVDKKDKVEGEGETSIEKLKEEHTVENLQELAKENNVKSYWNMNEDTLIKRLVEIGVL